MSNNLPQEKKNSLKALPFLEAGLVEFGFVAVVLLLLFGILNYFNILPVSSAIPQLSFLPRQSTRIPTKPVPQNFSAMPKTTPVPSGFQYDTEKAKVLLTQYIKDTIKPEFLPTKIEVKQGLSIDGRTEDIKAEFGSMFTLNNSSISANFHYKENSSIQNDFEVFIQPANVTQTTATVLLANSLLTSYFTNPYAISNCQTKGTTSYCENFQTLTEGKRGYGILIENSTSIVFYCFVPKESKDYDNLKSCVSP